MSTLFRSALVAVALFAGASAAFARPVEEAPRHHLQYDNGTDAALSFWDAQQRNGS